MARLPRGSDVLERAQELLSVVTDIGDLRMLQAVVFPLVHGMSIQETAKAIGMGVTWTARARNEFIRCGRIPERISYKTRNKAYMTYDEEADFLAPFFESASQSRILVVSVIHEALEQRLGHKVALASAYNLLHRHGWRKLVPMKRHIKADKQAQEDWKKNFTPSSNKSKKSGKDLVKSD